MSHVFLIVPLLIAWMTLPVNAQIDEPINASNPAETESTETAETNTAETNPTETNATDDVVGKVDPEQLAKEALAAEEPVEKETANPAPDDGDSKIDLLELLFAGGKLMIPIIAMSFVVVLFGIERLLGLRRNKVLPPGLIKGLEELAGSKDGFDPKQASELCLQYPSSAANVIRAMLLKIGRPHSEVEHALAEANEREAARLYSNVRWLSLAAGIAPLLGLLGTVWGMIEAFFVTAKAMPGANRSQDLAGGIYVALVTTFAGLSVAIPAAVLAHLFEGRIMSLFRQLDEILLEWMPQLERFEDRHRDDPRND